MPIRRRVPIPGLGKESGGHNQEDPKEDADSCSGCTSRLRFLFSFAARLDLRIDGFIAIQKEFFRPSVTGSVSDTLRHTVEEHGLPAGPDPLELLLGGRGLDIRVSAKADRGFTYGEGGRL